MQGDILKTLRAEHDLVRGLFDKIKDTTERAEKGRTDLLEQIEKNLIPHAKWEEAVLYPAFKARADRDGLQVHAEAVQEHRAVEETVIPDVHAVDVTTPAFAGRVKVFAEFIDHHASEEEKTMFKMCRELFSKDELAQFDADYAKWKGDNADTVVAEEQRKAIAKARLTPPA